MTATYKDGVGVERCKECGAALRDGAGATLVYLTLADVELLAIMLRARRMKGPLLERLERAIGQRARRLETKD